jgi:membrane-bound lytic murein transglycosylase D
MSPAELAPARPRPRELLIALLACLGACAHAVAPVPGPAPVLPVTPAPAVATPATPAATPERHFVPRGVVADGDKPPWMRELQAPDLPMRWYPRVSEYLERYRSEPRSHEIVSGWLRRLAAHRGPMEAALAHEGLPRGLVVVAMMESGLTANDVSDKGAVGYWQFMPDVARGYGLEVSFWIDERRDLARSSVAAARYLDDLHQRFGNWELALAGYHAGVYAVLDAIQRYNTNDFWTLCQVEAGLPWETTGYVPKALALAIVEKNRAAFGLEGLKDEPLPPFEEVTAPPATSLEALAPRLGVEPEVLQRLNPIYFRGRTPPDRPAVRIHVPPGKAQAALKAIARRRTDAIATVVVQPGDTLKTIAKLRKISLGRIRRLNAIAEGEEIAPGTTLIVPAPPRLSAAPEPAGQQALAAPVRPAP